MRILSELSCILPPEFRVVVHETNRGYGGVIRSGVAAAKKDWVFYTDGDAQYDVRELKLLADKISDDVDFINGWKIKRRDPLHRDLDRHRVPIFCEIDVRFEDQRCRLRFSFDAP